MGVVRGNAKLGKSIYHWSIPADERICHTASSLCADLCYARRGHFRQSNVKNSLEQNYLRSRQPGFVQYITDVIHEEAIAVFRIHASGEFYSASYIRNWINITRRAPRTEFFGYTRSWREPSFIPALTALAARPNVRLWLSSDSETGPPPEMEHTRTAYMQSEHSDAPAFPVDLVFRVKRNVVAKRVAGVMVCPVENAVTHTTCQQCQLCFRAQHHLDRINDYQRTGSLAVVS